MKRSSIVLAVVLCLVVMGCPIDPPVDPITTTTTVYQPDRYCERYYDRVCSDGSYIDVCVCYDLSCCGYRVKGRWFECAGCNPINCDGAAYNAVNTCMYGATFSKHILDEVDVEEIVEFKEGLIEALEALK
jgi:hypothetical protein